MLGFFGGAGAQKSRPTSLERSVVGDFTGMSGYMKEYRKRRSRVNESYRREREQARKEQKRSLKEIKRNLEKRKRKIFRDQGVEIGTKPLDTATKRNFRDAQKKFEEREREVLRKHERSVDKQSSVLEDRRDKQYKMISEELQQERKNLLLQQAARAPQQYMPQLPSSNPRDDK